MSTYKKTQTKRKTSSKKRRSTGKVYIPPYKTIALCIGIIIICLILLLITTLPKRTPEPDISSIAERFEEEPLKPEQEHLSSPDIKLVEDKPEEKQGDITQKEIDEIMDIFVDEDGVIFEK